MLTYRSQGPPACLNRKHDQRPQLQRGAERTDVNHARDIIILKANAVIKRDCIACFVVDAYLRLEVPRVMGEGGVEDGEAGALKGGKVAAIAASY